MSIQSDYAAVHGEVAAKQARLAFMYQGVDALPADELATRTTAIKSANDELAVLVEKERELRLKVEDEKLNRDLASSARKGTGTRQIDPENDGDWVFGGKSTAPRGPGGDWGDAVLKANQEQGGMSGLKSFITAGSATVAVSVGGPVEDPRRARFLSDLMPVEEAPGGHFAYMRQTARVNNAEVVAPAATKPTSVYSLTRVDDTTKVIAHLTEPVSRQDLDDAAILRQFLTDELRLGLDLAVDDRIVAVLNSAGILVEGDIGSTLDTTRRSLTRLQEREIEPSAFLLAPRDWEQIENEAQSAFASNSNMAPATDAVKRTLHGIPVFLSNAVPENTGYLGDFRRSAKLYRTGGVQIDWSEGHYDSGVGATDFERNLVRFRAEARLEVAILRTFAFVEINLAATGS